MLEQVARSTIDRLLTDAPPDPLDLGKAMAPMIEQRRVYALVRERQRASGPRRRRHETASCSATLADGDDGVSVAVVNASGNKIDSFLERDYRYDAELRADGTVTGTLTLRFTNDAPASGYPDYVIGNIVGLPTGWSRVYVTVYSSLRSAMPRSTANQRN